MTSTKIESLESGQDRINFLSNLNQFCFESEGGENLYFRHIKTGDLLFTKDTWQPVVQNERAYILDVEKADLTLFKSITILEAGTDSMIFKAEGGINDVFFKLTF